MDFDTLLAGADPATIKAMVDAGLIDEKMGIQAQQRQQGQHLLATPGAQLQQAGGTQVAASPLEHLAVALNKFKGQRMMDQAQAGQGALIDQKGQSMGTGWQQIINALKQRQAAGVSAPPDAGAIPNSDVPQMQ